MKNKLLYFLIFLLLFFAISCGEKGEVLPDLSRDDTDEAVKLVDKANKELKEIKKLYKANDGKVEDIKIAMKEQDVIKVRQLAKDAVTAIDEGIALGNSAIEKIDEARNLEINENFDKYLTLKEESLRKLVEAFESRRELAKSLSEEFITTDPERIAKVKAELMEKEKKFNEIIKEGQEKSREANQLAKDLLQKDNADDDGY
jgi:hypothetical protein